MQPAALVASVIGIVIVIFAPGCEEQSVGASPTPVADPTGAEVALTDVEGYDAIEIPFRVATVVRSEADWRKVNEEFVHIFNSDSQGKTTRHQLPQIDFDSTTVLLGSWGEVPCMLSEPARLFQKATVSSDTLYVRMGHKQSTPNSNSDEICLTAIDYLVHAVAVPKHHGPVEFYGAEGAVPNRSELF